MTKGMSQVHRFTNEKGEGAARRRMIELHMLYRVCSFVC
jgi:hypothetical protein